MKNRYLCSKLPISLVAGGTRVFRLGEKDMEAVFDLEVACGRY